jgi:SWI/SNF-related matrix-associated actin-dependent regulator 1 of chromatin subfamily A
MTTTEIESLVRWTKPKEVNTRNGPRILRTYKPRENDDPIWEVWGERKNDLKPLGLSMSKDPYTDDWRLCWWQKLAPEIIQERNERIELSRSLDADIEIPCPDGCEFRPFQKAGVNYILRAFKNNGVLLGDEMGTGKSIQAIGVINSIPEISRVLLICPMTLKANWERELRKWLIRKMSIGHANANFFPKTDIVIIHYNVVHKFPIASTNYWDLLIVDECHRAKSAKARQTKAIVGYKPTRKESAKGMLPSSGIPAVRKLFLSGTPFENKPAELWPIVSYIAPTLFSSKSAFEKRYCGACSNGYGWQADGATNSEELGRVLRGTCLIRRLKCDVLSELPPKQRIVVEMETEGLEHVINQEQRAWKQNQPELEDAEVTLELAKASEDQDAFKNAVSALRNKTALIFTEIAKVRHATALAKTPAMIEMLKEELEEVSKIVVFAHHTDCLRMAHASFPNESVLVTGDTPQLDRDKFVQQFQNDPSCRLFFGSIRATGEGITLTASSNVIFFENDWTASKMAQCSDRCFVKNTLVWCLNSVYHGSMALTTIQNIKIGDVVLTHSGNYRKVTDAWSHEHRGCMTKIHYVGWNDSIECTHDHRLMVKRGDKTEWIEAHSILPTDSMAFPKIKAWCRLESVTFKKEWRMYDSQLVPRSKQKCHCGNPVEGRGLCRVHYRALIESGNRPPKPRQTSPHYVRLPDEIKIDDDWLYLFGWYAAEGFSSMKPGKGYFVSFSGHEKEENVLIRISKKLLALGIKSTIYRKEGSKGIEMRAYSGELAKWFQGWFGIGSENFSLPSEIMNLPPDQAAIFLRGYTDGDGYQRNRQVEWVSCSQTLCYQACLLAIRAGFIPTMRRGSETSGYHWIGGYTKFGNPASTRLNDQDDDFIYRPVRSVETYCDKVRVYDITVEGDESFTTGFATAHNCHRIGQKDNVTVKYYILPGTIDAHMIQTWIRKEEILEKSLDSERAEIEAEVTLLPKTEKLATRTELERDAVTMTREMRQSIHAALRSLAMNCDGAKMIDSQGFNKFDARIGQSLAAMESLTPKCAALGKKLCIKYQRQLNPETLKQCGINE